MTQLNRRQRQMSERREQILATALKLFETKGYNDTSMEEIANVADVARGTLYNHFESKSEIFMALISTAKQAWQLEAFARTKNGESAVAMIEYILHQASLWVDDHPFLGEAFAEVFAQKMMTNKAQIRFIVPEELIKIAQDKKELTNSFDPQVLAALLDSIARYWTMKYFTQNSKIKISSHVQADVRNLLQRLK